MLMHPAFSLFIISLVSSIIITISANSWFMAWLGLEVNLLSFIPLIIRQKNKYSLESALKYFLIQALASIFFITSTSLQMYTQTILVIPAVALMMKVGAAPSHQWLPSMVDGLSWPITTVLMTLQKINPLILLFFISKQNLFVVLLYFYILASASVGAIGGLTQTSLRKLIAYSAIAHLSWMLSTILLRSWIWLMYFFMYSLILLTLVFVFNYSEISYLNQLFTMNKSYLSFLIAAGILSLGGLPPFSGFLPKLLAVNFLVPSNHIITLLPLLSASFITLFFYIRYVTAALILATSSPWVTSTRSKIYSRLLHLNLMALTVPTLSLAFM